MVHSFVYTEFLDKAIRFSAYPAFLFILRRITRRAIYLRSCCRTIRKLCCEEKTERGYTSREFIIERLKSHFGQLIEK